MSIPNTFRPLCGAGETWLPYVQPVMTSADTFAGVPGVDYTFGWVLTSISSQSDVPEPAWHAFDNSPGNGYQNKGTPWFMNWDLSNRAVFEFDKPLMVRAVTFLQSFYSGRTAGGFDLYCGERLLASYTRPTEEAALNPQQPYTITIPLSARVYSPHFEIRRTRGSYSYITNITFDAVYKA